MSCLCLILPRTIVIIELIRPGKSFTAARSRELTWVLGVVKWPFMSGRCAAASSLLPGCRTFSRPGIHEKQMYRKGSPLTASQRPVLNNRDI